MPVLAPNTDPVRAAAHIAVIAASTPESPCNDTATVAELPDGKVLEKRIRFSSRRRTAAFSTA